MKHSLHRAAARALAAGVLALVCAGAQAEIFGGVDFPGGLSSFADGMVSYTTNPVPNPTAPHRDPTNALGAPNFAGSISCIVGSCPYVSLGDGGTVILEFIDNRLTGSGSAALDLWVFEIGPDVEDTAVAISKDGQTYFEVGKVFGATSGIDIDAFGFGIADQFRFVRLIDDTNEGQQSGSTVGADIDAVGAISSVVAPPIPEPETWAMLMLGAAVIGLQRRRALAKAKMRNTKEI